MKVGSTLPKTGAIIYRYSLDRNAKTLHIYCGNESRPSVIGTREKDENEKEERKDNVHGSPYMTTYLSYTTVSSAIPRDPWFHCGLDTTRLLKLKYRIQWDLIELVSKWSNQKSDRMMWGSRNRCLIAYFIRFSGQVSNLGYSVHPWSGYIDERTAVCFAWDSWLAWNRGLPKSLKRNKRPTLWRRNDSKEINHNW